MNACAAPWRTTESGDKVNQTLRQLVVQLTHPFHPAVSASPSRKSARAQEFRIARPELVAIPQPLGLRVRCFSGALWITHDNHLCDATLVAGEQYVAPY